MSQKSSNLQVTHSVPLVLNPDTTIMLQQFLHRSFLQGGATGPDELRHKQICPLRQLRQADASGMVRG
jgi:hypothetical protein